MKYIDSIESDAEDNLICKINTGEFSYRDLEKLAELWRGKVCIRGAGGLGAGPIFDILTVAGIQVDYFMDANKTAGISIRDTEVIPLSGLKNERTLFIIAVGEKYQSEVISELSGNSLFKYITSSIGWIYQIVKSVKETGDEEANIKYGYWADDRICAERWMRERVGYDPDLDNPKTFNEKLQWLKLNDRDPSYTKLVDKYAVKEYVSNLIGEKYVIPTLGIWDDFDQINFENLPNQFALKCTHDSGSSIVCLDKKSFDYKKAREKLSRCLNSNFYYVGREWPYKHVKPQILCEKYIGDQQTRELLDYKIMCFNGRAKCSFICSDRESELKVNFYDREWNPMPFWRHYKKADREFPKPQNYEEMIALAEKLSGDLKFARVDFYNINGTIYFGEITLYPGNGFEEFHPVEWDEILGSWIDLS